MLAMTAAAQTTEYNIFDFGAVNDTTVVNTKAINDAIDACHRNGGGKVTLPAGKFKSGTIFMKDNVELNLAHGAYLYASENYADFPLQPHATYRSLKDQGGWAALIYAVGAKNIALTGNGVIDGRGKGRKGQVEGVAGDANGRPRNILFISCKGVNVSGVTMRNAAMWNQHYLDCEDVTVDHINVYNHCNGNNDGIDIDGCRNFTLTNSIIDSDDDGIVMKSTGTAPCENVIVSNCIVSSFANAIKCGTESTGGYKNIVVSNCVVKPSRNKGERILKSTPSGISAISLEVVDGGVMDGVIIDNIVIEGTECPIYVRLANRARKHIPEAPTPLVGKMRNIRISNITAYGTGNFCSSITGIKDGEIENIFLNNICFINSGGLQKGDYRSTDDMQGKRHDTAGNLWKGKYWRSHKDVKEDDKGYPQPTVWGNLPSYGLFIRNVRGMQVSHATFKTDGIEPRIPVIAVNVNGLTLERINVNHSEGPAVLLDNVRGYEIEKKLLKINKK